MGLDANTSLIPFIKSVIPLVPPLCAVAVLRRSRAFVQATAQIRSKELQSIATWNSITFSDADEKCGVCWVWFLLTFPFITHFTQTSTGGNKNLLSFHARSNFAALDMMLHLSFPPSSLSNLSSFPLRKGALSKHALGQSFLCCYLLMVFWPVLTEDERSWG